MIGSPLPQEYAHSAVTPVRIVGGFTTALPGRDRIFFNRIYFAPMPYPIQKGTGNPYPFGMDVATIEVPKTQALVVRQVAFRVFQHSGIAVDDYTEVDPARAATNFGFEFKMGNRGMTDFNTNLAPDPGSIAPVGGLGPFPKVVNPAIAGLSPGGGQLFPFAGPITPVLPNESFASYARPQDLVKARVFILREPNFDVRFFSVSISGFLANETDLDRMLDMLSR